MHFLLILSLLGNLITVPPAVIKIRNRCSHEEAVAIEKNSMKKAWNDFLQWLAGKEFKPTSIGLLQNSEFCESVCNDWRNLSSIQIDVLRTREGVYFTKPNVLKGFQYIMFEFVGTADNLSYFMIAVENHLTKQLQILGYPEPFINSFSKTAKNSESENHFVCTFQFSTNETELEELKLWVESEKEKQKQKLMQEKGLSETTDSKLEQEFKNAGVS